MQMQNYCFSSKALLRQAGYNLVTHAFPGHAERVRGAFGVLDKAEKRQLADLCRKLDRAA